MMELRRMMMKGFIKGFVFLCLFFSDVFSDNYSDFVRGCRNGSVVAVNVVAYYNDALNETKKYIALNNDALSSLSKIDGYLDSDEQNFYTTELELYATRLQILSLEGMKKADFISPECLEALNEANVLETEENLFSQAKIDPSILKY